MIGLPTVKDAKGTPFARAASWSILAFGKCRMQNAEYRMQNAEC
jgi:hypothetical protein